MEDVVDCIELLVSVETAAELAHDLADAAEDAGALEAEVFAVADEVAGFVDEESFEEGFGG